MSEKIKQKIIGINILHEEFTPKEVMNYISELKQESSDEMYLDSLKVYELNLDDIITKQKISLDDKLVSITKPVVGAANQIAELTMELYQTIVSYNKKD